VRCPWFGIDLDPVALLRDTWPTDEIFSHLGQILRHVRGKDAVAGSEARTKPAILARGDVKWRDILDALDGAGYGGWITIDPMELTDRRGAAVAGLKQLKAYME
jgi:sugar phosphate isomerase/epimerase